MSVASSLSAYPHSLSYFNEAAGGSRRGHRHLISANIDWGQDMLYLKEWLDEHPQARPLRMQCGEFVPAQHYGINALRPLPGPALGERFPESNRWADALGPQPGWHAMSVQSIQSRDGRFTYFHRFRPTAYIGYSIRVYHVTLDDANAARRELGMPKLRAAKPESGMPSASSDTIAERANAASTTLQEPES